MTHCSAAFCNYDLQWSPPARLALQLQTLIIIIIIIIPHAKYKKENCIRKEARWLQVDHQLHWLKDALYWIFATQTAASGIPEKNLIIIFTKLIFTYWAIIFLGFCYFVHPPQGQHAHATKQWMNSHVLISLRQYYKLFYTHVKRV